MKKIRYILFSSILIILVLAFLNKETTRKIGINDELFEYEIPIYLKIFDFYNRHYNYKYLAKKIINNSNNKEDVIINTTRWIHKNIQKIPVGVEIVDHHPLTIIERRLGVHSQFNDILSVLLVYSEIDSFFIRERYNDSSYSLTFFKYNDYWSVIDPYHGIYFLNDNEKFASIEDIYSTNWHIVNLDLEKIETLNISEIYNQKFQEYEEVKWHYKELLRVMLNDIDSSNQIDKIKIFDRGGRSYVQQPLNRLKFEINKLFK